MPVFQFYETTPNAAFGLSFGGALGSTFTVSDDAYDVGIATAELADDADDNDVLQEVNGPTDDALATITLSDGSSFDAGIKLERVWTLAWMDEAGQSQSVRVAEFEYNPVGPAGDVDALLADGPLPPPGTSVTVTDFVSNVSSSDDGFPYADITTDIACFASGTLIETKEGAKPVEALAVGDLVRTRDNGWQPIRWVGGRTVAAVGSFAPVVIPAGVLGNVRDLVLSPCHRILSDDPRNEILYGEREVLVTARQLCGRRGVTARPGGIVTYYHVMFDRHEIIYAEGTPTESFLVDEKSLSAMDEATRAEVLDLFPELAAGAMARAGTVRPTLHETEAAILVV